MPPTSPDIDNHDDPGPCYCMRDDVSVSAEAPRCPHPTSACPSREHCAVREAMRRKARPPADPDTEAAG